jgi:hypothetical protein
MATSDEPLRGPRFETRPKEILRIQPFTDHTRIVKSEPYASDFLEFVRSVENGLPLGRGFYRREIDTTADELLETHGIKHVHLGGAGSDVLLFAAEYEDVVILLEINDHKHFRTDPIGSLLIALHERKMAQAAAAAAGPAAERREHEERIADRRRRFAEAKKNGWKKPIPKA